MFFKESFTQFCNINNFVKSMTQFDSKLIAQAKKTKGYLFKKSNGVFSKWKKFYFLVLEQSLCIFQDQTLQSLTKTIKFSQILHIIPFNTFQIQIKTKRKIYYLKTNKIEDKDLWLASLNILKENYFQNSKNPTQQSSSSHSREKQIASSQAQTQSTRQKSIYNDQPKKYLASQKITFLLREKQLSKLLTNLNLQQLFNVTKQQKYLSRILFIEDKKNGIYFLLASKSLYPIIDGDLVKSDFIYPYQLNVLYFISNQIYKNGFSNKQKTPKLVEICKSSEILECILIDQTIIKLQIDCQKSLQIQVKHLSEIYVNGLMACFKKAVQVGKQYWNPRGKLTKNIDLFLEKYEENQKNQLSIYKMVQIEFQQALNTAYQSNHQKSEVENFFTRIDNLMQNLTGFIDGCEIKTPPLLQVKQKYVKLYHKFTYNYMNQTWNSIYKHILDQQLIIYSKKVYQYYQIINPIYKDSRIKQGSKTLLKLALKNFSISLNALIENFTNVQEQSLRIMKKVEFQNKSRQLKIGQIFFNSFCNNFFSLISTQFKFLAQIPKNDQFTILSWISMKNIFKTAFQSLLAIGQNSKDRSTLISICNSLKFLKNKRLPELISQTQKTFLSTNKKQRQVFLKEINHEISLVESFCVKKLFIISFSSIDKEILKCEVKYIDFYKICSVVNEEISKLEYVLPEVKVAMYEAAFEQVCYFLYVCVVKFDNKNLSKDECLSMINQKMLTIKQAFSSNVDQDKLITLLCDLNLLKQFITCPLNNIKAVTKELKKVFGSNFTQLNLKNLISLRVNILKQKQYLFQQCRQEIKSSYNSTDQIQSFQRQSYFNNTYGRERKSTLTESIQSYCDHHNQKVESTVKGESLLKTESLIRTQRAMLFQFSSSIKESFIYRKKVLNSNINTSYTRFFYRLKKGQLLQYDNQFSQDVLNSYMLSQLKKCYLQPERNQIIHLEFGKQVLKLKMSNLQEANEWVNEILEAKQEQKFMKNQLVEADKQEGALFEDLSKKITFETKQTQQASSPYEKNKTRNKRIPQSESMNSKVSPKRHQNYSPMIYKKNYSPQKNVGKNYKQVHKSKHQKSKKHNKKSIQKQSGCGTGCNFL